MADEVPVSTKYTNDQLEKLKVMSKNKKKSIQCRRCGEYFHSSDKCDRPGPPVFQHVYILVDLITI